MGTDQSNPVNISPKWKQKFIVLRFVASVYDRRICSAAALLFERSATVIDRRYRKHK